MTDLSFERPKSIRLPAIRFPKIPFGRILTPFTSLTEAYYAAQSTAYMTALGFGASAPKPQKREDDY